MTVVLKHLAQEFSMNPHRIRAILREANHQPKDKRWKWDPKSAELKKIRKLLGEKSADSPSS